MSAKFDMHIIVPAKMIGTIVELLAGEGILVSVAPKAPDNGHTKAHRGRYSPGTGGRTINSGRTVVLEALKTGPKTIKELEDLFRTQGRASNSVSPVLSGLSAAGTIKVDRLTKKVSIS